jgi:hypothetical protein
VLFTWLCIMFMWIHTLITWTLQSGRMDFA